MLLRVKNEPKFALWSLIMIYRIGYLVGSLSAHSVNRKLANSLVRLAPGNLEFSEIPIRDLPLYDRDLDGDFPASAVSLKAAIEAADALLFVTPEYNRGVPGVLKNAIDWASRPSGQNSWDWKPAATIGASPGKLGTALAQESLRATLSFLNVPQMNSPEAFIQATPGFFADDGSIGNPGTEDFLRLFMQRYEQFVARVINVLPQD